MKARMKANIVLPEEVADNIPLKLSRSDEVKTVLKIDRDAENDELELEYELAYQLRLTTRQRFEMMFSKSCEMIEVMLRHGYRKPFEVIKRT